MNGVQFPVSLRLANEDDEPLIRNAWAKTVQDAAPYRYMPSTNLFFKGINKEITALLGKSQTFVLCSEDDPDLIFSFAVTQRMGEILVIHFAYTKATYWRLGLMRKLLQMIEPEIVQAGAVYTCFAPSLVSKEWYVAGEEKPKQFLAHLRDKYSIIMNPFAKDIE